MQMLLLHLHMVPYFETNNKEKSRTNVALLIWQPSASILAEWVNFGGWKSTFLPIR